MTQLQKDDGVKIYLTPQFGLYIQKSLQVAQDVDEIDFDNCKITLKQNVSALLLDGTTIKLEGGPSGLNGFWVVERVEANTKEITIKSSLKNRFKELKPIDWATAKAKVTGCKLRVVTFSDQVISATEYATPGSSYDSIEVTSTANFKKQTVAGNETFNEVNFELLFDPENESHLLLIEAYENKQVIAFKNVLSGVHSVYFFGTVMGKDDMQFSAGSSDAMKRTFKLAVNDAYEIFATKAS
ncbi:hypothetical protein CKF54_00875 [Psittacicella hinzii]|uniref:Uncharacterized protein n=1 Tax=Psittacicella hinzii TaxID=2028575 RepID=A0A3A1YAF8_9GAMM|nr:hypothetical protein [Psittacicella hinzii]RIY34326.1 hypothetical protein CKF54_00875 [Psittacicella hinzii]